MLANALQNIWRWLWYCRRVETGFALAIGVDGVALQLDDVAFGTALVGEVRSNRSPIHFDEELGEIATVQIWDGRETRVLRARRRG